MKNKKLLALFLAVFMALGLIVVTSLAEETSVKKSPDPSIPVESPTVTPYDDDDDEEETPEPEATSSTEPSASPSAEPSVAPTESPVPTYEPASSPDPELNEGALRIVTEKIANAAGVEIDNIKLAGSEGTGSELITVTTAEDGTTTTSFNLADSIGATMAAAQENNGAEAALTFASSVLQSALNDGNGSLALDFGTDASGNALVLTLDAEVLTQLVAEEADLVPIVTITEDGNIILTFTLKNGQQIILNLRNGPSVTAADVAPAANSVA